MTAMTPSNLDAASQNRAAITHQVVLRPRSLMEIGDLTTAFLRTHPLIFAKVLPIALSHCLLVGLLANAKTDAATCWWILWALGPVTCSVATVIGGDLLLNPSTSARSAIMRWRRGLGGLVGGRLLDLLVKSLTFGLLAGSLSFFPEVVLLERGGATAISRRSGHLLSATPGRWISLSLLALLVPLLGLWAGEVAWHGLRWVTAMPKAPSALVEQGWSWPALVGFGCGQFYFAVMRFLAYIDARTRREGWDLAVRFAGLCDAARVQGSGARGRP